ncbi:MAG TPA: hypothetical protein VJQ57_13630 [Acidimicrobiia bacterium]|nr:hypothetical protein [Acidimicrobiia bacterium]
MSINATIVRAPGYADHFKAKVIPGLGNVPARDGREELAVVTFGEGELAVVPARCVVTGLDLVKRFELDYDWSVRKWGVRHAFGGPFVYYGSDENDCRAWHLRKL